jgi:hypothetical protein
MQKPILLAHEVEVVNQGTPSQATPQADAQIEESISIDSAATSTASTSSYFGPTQKALAASVLVTVLIVAAFALIARKRGKGATQEGQTSRPSTPTLARVLVGLGLFFFGLGAFYSLASHGLHEALPFLAALPHSAHIYIGAGGAILGLVLLLVGERIKKRHQIRFAKPTTSAT